MANRTALFSRNQPGGVFSIQDLKAHPGDIWFVDSNASAASDAAGFGQSPDAPFATLDYAIGKCTADKGDVIYVMPGHSEVLGVAGVTMDVAGVKVVGLGEGDNRPHFHFTGTDSTFLVTGAGCVIENLRFLAGISAVVVGLNVTAASTIFRNCEWYYGGTTGWDFVIALQFNAGSHRSAVENCKFLGEPATAGCAVAVKVTGASHNVTIKGCEIFGDYSTAAINGITTLSQGLNVIGNLFHTTNADEPAVEVLTGTTGVVALNVGLATATTIADAIASDAQAHVENYLCNTAGTIAIQKGAGGTPALDVDAA